MKQQKPRCPSDASVRLRNLRHFKRAVCVSTGFPETDTRHLDLPVSGTFDLHSNDYAKKICPILFI